MQKELNFHEKMLAIKLSPAAERQSRKLQSILIIEIQIYFSCLLGKRLAFYSEKAMQGSWQLDSEELSSLLKNAQPLTDNIYIRFNTVMTKTCSVSDYAGPPPVSDFAIKNQKPYVPSWLNIDFKHGLWSGEYGWHGSEPGFSNTKQIRGEALVS